MYEEFDGLDTLPDPGKNAPRREYAPQAYREGRLEDARRALIEEYAEKPLRRMIQVDAHKTAGDWVMPADEDGQCIMMVEEVGLYNAAGTSEMPVRVLIAEGSDKAEVLLMLKKCIEVVEDSFDDTL